jgi:protein-L-isoaspartate(D-aspartate) O-methyltransferase
MTTPVLDIERARFNMIEQQIRPWEVLDQSVLDLLAAVKREEFVPPAYRNLAFVDMEVPLSLDGCGSGECMLTPKVEARVLQALALRPDDQVLEIGAGSGYMAALLGARAGQVTSVELNPQLLAFARHNLQKNGMSNVQLELGDGARGWNHTSGYDAIVISGGLPFLPESFLQALKPHGRLTAFIGAGPVMDAVLVTRTADQSFDTVALFETQVPYLHHAETVSRFRF